MYTVANQYDGTPCGLVDELTGYKKIDVPSLEETYDLVRGEYKRRSIDSAIIACN